MKIVVAMPVTEEHKKWLHNKLREFFLKINLYTKYKKRFHIF